MAYALHFLFAFLIMIMSPFILLVSVKSIASPVYYCKYVISTKCCVPAFTLNYSFTFQVFLIFNEGWLILVGTIYMYQCVHTCMVVYSSNLIVLIKKITVPIALLFYGLKTFFLAKLWFRKLFLFQCKMNIL